jgi:hypothetical protein
MPDEVLRARRLKAGGSQEWVPHNGDRSKGERGRQMDLQLYYQKIREMESKIGDEFAIVVSLETSDGGKSGRKTEVPRRLAAKLLVEGQVRLATKDEVKAHRESLAEAVRLAERAAAAAKLQLTVLSANELDRLRSDARGIKE